MLLRESLKITETVLAVYSAGISAKFCLVNALECAEFPNCLNRVENIYKPFETSGTKTETKTVITVYKRLYAEKVGALPGRLTVFVLSIWRDSLSFVEFRYLLPRIVTSTPQCH
jgi:hypothetical protein